MSQRPPSSLIAGLRDRGGDRFAHGEDHELRPVVSDHGKRLAAFYDVSQGFQHLGGIELALCPDGLEPPCVLLDQTEHRYLPAIIGPVVDELIRPGVVRPVSSDTCDTLVGTKFSSKLKRYGRFHARRGLSTSPALSGAYATALTSDILGRHGRSPSLCSDCPRLLRGRAVWTRPAAGQPGSLPSPGSSPGSVQLRPLRAR